MFHPERGWTKKNEFKKVKEGGITVEEKIIRKEAGEAGKCSIKLKAGNVSRKNWWWAGDRTDGSLGYKLATSSK